MFHLIGRSLALICLLVLSLSQSKSEPNTSRFPLEVKDLIEHQRQFLLEKSSLSIYPEILRTESLTKSPDSKRPTLLMVFKSSSPENRKAISSFLNLWYKHRKEMNFILIDSEKPINYYGISLLKQHWQNNQPLKVIAFSPKGKIRIQLEDVRDLGKLDRDLHTLAKEFSEEKSK